MTTTRSPQRAQLTELLPGLLATPPEALPFPDSVMRTFLLERDHGDILVYNAPAAAEISARWQYLGHWHEAMFGPGVPDAHVVVDAADAAETVRRLDRDVVTFAGEHALGEGFEILPIPGHTPGSTAYRFETDEHRFLFTADSIMLRADGSWTVAVLDSSDRLAYLESLDRLREVEFDVLVPWAASANGPAYALTDPADTRRRIGALLDEIWAGSNRPR